ncbi:MAG: hypothetical protein A3H73_03520 [Candidatus Taylorbacteria bacterium RIFCSPLOWO2_02_FULL_50_120]|nr:MAG: hypothetical protein A2759_03250 [Candidatus Taylorbacteria bacterium RIFCSPHIGHO2_01_FULL_49_60]OHA37050.1 MAG: hypothetical protein A3B27_01765 [Candidatus Taylorbacteria bacterium RIFCSPLOWO2_01_FULL_50_130]OHA40106.1 MAG: hypothetical protein A3H73_03520 [Candidatus Taylorbacteria bacterium RIFCSPLOWO2_02_FULL_50_120]OHA46347.1 MAG: hypothetical protein A3G61_01905 [Candidatus Taylorbacteria bacterium RIFCSPLOWO2_12_FULL_49_67]HCB35021.1 hypothetical protein [Candidatus Taylorbacter
MADTIAREKPKRQSDAIATVRKASIRALVLCFCITVNYETREGALLENSRSAAALAPSPISQDSMTRSNRDDIHHPDNLSLTVCSVKLARGREGGEKSAKHAPKKSFVMYNSFDRCAQPVGTRPLKSALSVHPRERLLGNLRL